MSNVKGKGAVATKPAAALKPEAPPQSQQVPDNPAPAPAPNKPAATNVGGKNGRLEYIEVARIRENVHSLRSVKKEEEKYQQLVDSVKQRGVLNPIVVKEIPDPEKEGEKLYGLVDGLQRYSAALDAGAKMIPAHIKDMNQAEIEESQIVLNLIRIETKPAEYAKALNTILERNPIMSIKQLADKLSCGEQWLKERLSLLKLPEQVQGLVDEGKIKLGNAKELAKLPPEEVPNYVERAMTERPDQFVPTVAARLTEIRKARREGREAKGPEPFKPHPYQRSWGEVKDEYAEPAVGPELINNHKAKTALDGWKLAIAWVCRMDPAEQQARIEENAKKEKERDDQKQKLKAEKEKKKQEEAARVQHQLEQGEFKVDKEAAVAVAGTK